MSPLKVMISPSFPNPDVGDGGIRRVVEAQRKYLPQFGVEVVETESAADVVACHAGSYIPTSKPFVAHNHGLYWSDYSWSEWAHSLNNQVVNVLRRADRVTAPSNWVNYIIRRGMNIEARTVYHGIDMDEWTPGEKKHPYVLWNKSRVDPICDPAPLNAVAKLLPHVDFVSTYGEPASNVRITGRVPYDQAKSLVRNASVYLATARETFGIGTLEAMAAGVVVVGYDWAGQSEIVQHGVDGLLCNPDDVDALARLIEQSLNESGTLVESARRRMDRFTWEDACAAYAAVYHAAYAEAAARTKRVSVIITSYNLADTLPRAVASVDMDDAEIVVVNDASPDDTGAVAERLANADPRIRVITNENNLYLAGSLDAGIRAATGRYVLPLDADNELAPGALDTLANALDNDPDIDIAYGSMEVVEEAKGVRFISGWPTTHFSVEQQLAHRNQIPSTSMYRRKWWERAGGYRRRCRTAEDADFWCRVASLGAWPKKVTEQVTLIYHDRSDSMSHVEADWPWENWYTWGRIPALMPFGAPSIGRKAVPTYQPPLVTVIIPVGPGHEKYLPDALDSLAAQTTHLWRCVVVDDRPDNTDEGPSPLGLPPWVEYIESFYSRNEGPAHTRNRGLRVASTPYVLFLDADDYLAPNALEVLLGAARERGWTSAKEWYYSDWYKQEEGKVYTAPDFVAEHLRTHLTHSVTAMYPTALLREVAGFDEELDAWEDWDMVLKLIEAGACGVHIPYPLFYYRYGAGWRREELYKDRARHTEVMKRKWRKYMVENAEMPCGCQGGRTTYVAPVQADGVPIPVSKDGKTLMEFIGKSAPRTWRGPSGAEYRFGSDEGHRIRYVANEDLQVFLNRVDFRPAQGDVQGMVILQAAGPPNRAAEYAEPPPYEGAEAHAILA